MPYGFNPGPYVPELPIGPNYGRLAGEQFGSYAPSGGGGMPPAVVAAGIGAAGSLGGALLGNKGQSNALKSQERANQQAMQYQREKDAAADKRYERDYADWQRRQAAKDATRRAIAKHYGIDLPEAAPAAAPGAAPSGPAAPQPGQVHAGVPGGGAYRVRPEAPAAPPPQLSPEALKLGFSGPASATKDGGYMPGMGPAAPAAPMAAPEMSPEEPPEMSKWNDWSRYAHLS